MNNYAELRAALEAVKPGDGDAMLAYRLASGQEVIRALLAERDALLDQHHRGSKDLRRLCAQRDAARKVSKEAGAVVAGLKAERDALREALDELANGYAGSGWDIGLRQRLQKARAALAQGEA